MRFGRVVRLAFLMVALAAASLGLAAPAAAADRQVHLDGGRTVLTVDRATLKVLTDNDVSVTPIRGASANGRSFTFPITGGSVDAESLAGTIEHSGGLRFSEGGDRLGVQDFVIDTKEGVLTARVSGTKTRVPLLKLDLGSAHIDRGHGSVVISNVRASLTGEAADALNEAFDVSLFEKGLAIGTAKVTARF
jgi:hypothetical protein